MTSFERSRSFILTAILCCLQATASALTSPLRPVTSSSGEPISVQHLDSMNDVHSQSTTTSHDDAVAKQLSLRLSLKTSSSVVLNLTRSQLIDDQTPVYVANHSNVTRWTSAPVNQSFVVFTDAANHATMLLKSRVTSSGHVIRTYEGTFRLNNSHYLLTSQPSQRRQRRETSDDDDATTTADNDDYVAYRLQTRTLDNVTDEVVDGDEVDKDNQDDWMQYANITSQFHVYVVEVLMVIDYAIYRSWYDLSRERTPTAKHNDAINSIRYYYTHVTAGMDMRFATIQAGDFNIKIRFSGLYIATTRADSPWTESDQSRFVVDDVVYVNSGKALDQFENWVKNTAPSLDLPPFDQATLFTGNIVTSSSSNKDDIRRIAGLGNIDGVCTSRGTTVCQEWNEFASVGTAAHELGHNLGAYHDGQDNGCSSEDQYVMAKSPTQLSDANFLKPYQFSDCSITYFRAFLNRLNTQKVNCMLNSSTVDVRQADETITLPPGQFIPVDKQCQLLYGSDSFYCAGARNDRSICERMSCYISELKQCHTRTEQRAANGTTCGDRMWCYKGRCVRHEKAPHAAAHCVYGDSKVPFDDETTCTTKLATTPSHCYQENYNSTCCYTCQQIRNQHSSDCPYGDRNENYCRKLQSRDCYDVKVQHACCDTCRSFRHHFSDCEYGDKASWCAEMTEGSQCYDERKRRNCCFTCKYLRSYGRPGCEYGDRAAWCQSYTAEQCQQQDSVRDTCCLTCNGTSNGFDASCTDHADWCPSIAPSYCYATDKTCCRTCRAHNIHIAGCEYGNRYSWCSTAITRDDCKQKRNVDDCCHTCFLLTNIARTTPTPSRASLTHNARHLTTVALLSALLARWRSDTLTVTQLFIPS